MGPLPAAVAAAAATLVIDPAASAPGPNLRRDTLTATPNPGPVLPDITTSDVVREAVSVFGDAPPPPSPAAAKARPGGPVWDIDVRSYETHDRVEHFV